MWCCTVVKHGITYIGKSTKTEAWYGVQEMEHGTRKGFTICTTALVASNEPSSPCVVSQEGYGELWFALASTEHGTIPAKASRAQEGVVAKCWYTYGGAEICITENFTYLVADSVTQS
jgi:hypothetical protein